MTKKYVSNENNMVTWSGSFPTPFRKWNYKIRKGLKYDFLHMILSVKKVNIVFYKTKTL